MFRVLLVILCLLFGSFRLFGSGVNEGLRETYIEYYRLKLDSTYDYSVIGGHYTYFFSDHLAVGPGFYVPYFDLKEFQLGVLFHTYYYPFRDAPVLPFLYLETGFHLTDERLSAQEFGLGGNQKYINWGGVLRAGAGISVNILESSSMRLGIRTMLYYSSFLLHYYRYLPERTSMFFAAGMYLSM